MTVRGKLPDPDRTDKILKDPEAYFAAARERNRAAIRREDAARRTKFRRARLA